MALHAWQFVDFAAIVLEHIALEGVNEDIDLILVAVEALEAF